MSLMQNVVFPGDYRTLSVMWVTASNVSLTATASPGSIILSQPLNASVLLAKYVILYGSITLYNSNASAVNEVIQVFIGSKYINVHEVTVPAGGYVVVPVQYVLTGNNMPFTGTTVGLAAYGGSLTATYAYMMLSTIG